MDFRAYKAVLFDVDKTLANSKREITPTTRQALKELSDKNYSIGICTGRHFATVGGLISVYFPSTSFHVLAGGGLVTDSLGTEKYQNNLSDDVVRKLAPIALEFDCRLVIQRGSDIYGNEKAMRFQSNYVLASSQQKQMANVSTLTDWSVPLVVIGGVNDEVLEKLQTMPLQYKVMKGYTGEPYVDITNVGVTKATGTREWCKITGIQPEEVIGFGDSENDIEFLRTVGYSVAMGNSTKDVQSIAHEVTEDCDHDGVAVWIERNIK